MQNVILINSHRRSGTHFLIDSLRANISKAYFPNHFYMPADFNIGCLHAKSDKVYNIFKKEINSDGILIVKSHLLPEEMNLLEPKDKHEQLIKDIYLNAKKIYIYRDGMDTLVSLYHFFNNSMAFSEFLKTENDHIPKEVRSKNKYDLNRVLYWAYHVEAWKLSKNTFILQFNDLKNNFEDTLRNIMGYLELPSLEKLKKPAIPKRKLLHAIKIKLSFWGLTPLPESSSVRPRKGNVGDSVTYFKSEDEVYFNSQTKLANKYV